MTRPPLTAHGKVIAGRVCLDNPAPYKAALSRWEGRIILTVEPEPTTRSGRQNRFYWKYLQEWAKVTETGYSATELHEIEAYRHNSRVLVIEGEECKVAQTTTKLTVEQFSVYLERMMVDAAHWDSFFLEPTPVEDWR